MTDRPRLIEVAFPLKQASLDSVYEKNIRHGHISTLEFTGLIKALQKRERVREELGPRERTVGIVQRAGRSVCRLASAEIERAQNPHRNPKLDVHDVVAGAPSVRETGIVAAKHAETILSSIRRRSNRRVETQHFRDGDVGGFVEPVDAGRPQRDSTQRTALRLLEFSLYQISEALGATSDSSRLRAVCAG